MSILYDMRSGTIVKSKPYTNGLTLKEVINSNITTPSVSSVSVYLLNGGGESAISYAMVELADGATDWVLDPANNAVKYKVEGGAVDTAVHQYKVQSAPFASSDAAACAAYVATLPVVSGREPPALISVGSISDTKSSLSGQVVYAYFCNVRGSYGSISDVQGFMYGEKNMVDEPDRYEFIPIDTVAAKVIANAEAGHAPSQEAVNNSVKIN